MAATVACGASFTATTLSVVVAVVTAAASETLHVRVRVVLSPKFVGVSLVEWNPTVCSRFR